MPFQPINFANIAPQGNEFMKNFVDNLAKGYAFGQMPAQFQRQREKEEIANAMSKLLLEEEPQKFKSQQSARGLSNALRQMQMQQLQMELDPNKKAAYINQLANAFGGDNQNQTIQENSGVSNDIRNQLIRKALGLPAQTPQEKMAQDLELYRQKIQLKGSGDVPKTAAGDVPTTATVTANQKVIGAIDNVLPLIEDLEKYHAPGQLLSKYLKPDAQATYESKVGTIVDSLVGALKLPQVKESLNIVDKIVGKRPFESDKSYLKRLAALKTDLIERRKRAVSNAGSRASAPTGGGNDDPLGLRG